MRNLSELARGFFQNGSDRINFYYEPPREQAVAPELISTRSQRKLQKLIDKRRIIIHNHNGLAGKYLREATEVNPSLNESELANSEFLCRMFLNGGMLPTESEEDLISSNALAYPEFKKRIDEDGNKFIYSPSIVQAFIDGKSLRSQRDERAIFFSFPTSSLDSQETMKALN